MNGIVYAVEPFARGATSVLVNALWEDVAIFVLVALLLRAWPRLNAATRYALWFVALVASIAVPVFSTFWPVGTAVSATVATATHHHADATRTSAVVTTGGVSRHDATTAKDLASQPSGATSGFRAPAFAASRIVVPAPVADAVLALWIVALALFLARLALGLARLQRLKKNALPLPLEHRDALARLASAPHGGRDVRICVSDEASVPVAVGLFDSMILVPRHLLDSLTHEDVEHICLHEMAHLRRSDDWTNLLQRLVTALAWFSPAIYAIARGLDLEREVACDDDVVATMGAVRPYARCLTKMAEITAWPHHALAAPGVFATRRGISERIERLLRAGRNAARGLSLGPTAVAIAAIAFLTLGMRTVAPIAAAPAAQEAPQKPVALRTMAKHVTLAAVAIAPVATAVPVATRRVVRLPATHVRVPAEHIRMPAYSVHVPAVNVTVPEVHVDVPGVDVDVPGVNVTVPLHDASCDSACDFERVDWPERDVSGRAFSATDFSHANLAGANFSGDELNVVDFARANLRNANFDGATLSYVDFSHAILDGARFRGAKMDVCDFTGVDMRRVDLSGAALGTVCRMSLQER